MSKSYWEDWFEWNNKQSEEEQVLPEIIGFVKKLLEEPNESTHSEE